MKGRQLRAWVIGPSTHFIFALEIRLLSIFIVLFGCVPFTYENGQRAIVPFPLWGYEFVYNYT